MVYNNNDWKVKNRDETITDLIDDNQSLLEQKIGEWVASGNKYPDIIFTGIYKNKNTFYE